jgi:hypothetical protein
VAVDWLAPEATTLAVPITIPDAIVTVGSARAVAASPSGAQATRARNAATGRRWKMYCILSRDDDRREDLMQRDEKECRRDDIREDGRSEDNVAAREQYIATSLYHKLICGT